MAENSAIEWTHHTFNPWSGCQKVAPECEHCYAEANYSVKMRGVKWGPMGNRIVKAESGWKEPLKWNRHAEAAGERHRVFCASLADVFEDWSGPMLGTNGLRQIACPDCGVMSNDQDTENCPQCGREALWVTMDMVRRRLFDLIDATPHLDWLLLTKRPENIRRMCYDWLTEKVHGHVSQNEGDGRHWKQCDNLWLGTSAGTQATAVRAIPELLKCRDLSPVLFVSAEPLLEKIDIRRKQESVTQEEFDFAFQSGRGLNSLFPDWFIGGFESGPKARPGNPDWARSLRDQCTAAGVPFLWKQNGEWCQFSQLPPECENMSIVTEKYEDPRYCRVIDGHSYHKIGKKSAGRLLDGKEWNQFPEIKTCVKKIVKSKP